MTLRKLSAVINKYAASINLLVILIGSLVAANEWYDFKRPHDDYLLRQSKINTELAEQKPTDDDGNISVKELKKYPDGSRLYEVEFNVHSKNLSKSQITLSYSIAELYLGDMDLKGLNLGEATLMNSAPDPWHGNQDGPIKWVKKKYNVAIADGDTDKKVLNWLHERYADIGHEGLTAVLPSGSMTMDEPDFFIRAMPDQYVSVVYSYGINNSIDVNGPDVVVLSDIQLLRDADRPYNKKEKQ